MKIRRFCNSVLGITAHYSVSGEGQSDPHQIPQMEGRLYRTGSRDLGCWHAAIMLYGILFIPWTFILNIVLLWLFICFHFFCLVWISSCKTSSKTNKKWINIYWSHDPLQYRWPQPTTWTTPRVQIISYGVPKSENFWGALQKSGYSWPLTSRILSSIKFQYHGPL